MALIAIAKKHHLSHKKAKEAAEKVAEDLNARFDLEYAWKGDNIEFRRPGPHRRVARGQGHRPPRLRARLHAIAAEADDRGRSAQAVRQVLRQDEGLERSPQARRHRDPRAPADAPPRPQRASGRPPPASDGVSPANIASMSSRSRRSIVARNSAAPCILWNAAKPRSRKSCSTRKAGEPRRLAHHDERRPDQRFPARRRRAPRRFRRSARSAARAPAGCPSHDRRGSIRRR